MKTNVEYSSYWEDNEATQHECDGCGNFTECCYTADPYAEEIGGTLHLQWMCHDCYSQSVQDI